MYRESANSSRLQEKNRKRGREREIILLYTLEWDPLREQKRNIKSVRWEWERKSSVCMCEREWDGENESTKEKMRWRKTKVQTDYLYV